MAKKITGVWGVDLGQCALKAVRIENVDGQIVATAFDYVEHPKLLNQPDAEPDQMIREALQTFLSRNTLKGDIIAISVPSQSGLARFVKLPPVEEKKIADIVRFEAKQQIPFSLDEVVWDYQKIGAGVVTDGFAMDTEIGLFAMKRDKVSSYLEHFRDVGVDVHIVQMSPLALCNFVAYDLLGKGAADAQQEEAAKKSCIVALDIGTDNSNLVVTDGYKIIWQRPIPLGGNHFTRALTKDPFKLTFAKAEHLKRNATKSGPELKKILTALKPVLNDFVQEVQRSLGYFTNTHRDAQVQYMVGLGNAFRLPGFQRFLSEKLQLDVRKLNKIEKLTGDTVTQAPIFTENVLAFAVAYGLALQGVSLARLQTNLLPPEIRMERLIKAKKPWAVAAAALLLLGVGGLLVGKGKAYNEYNPDQPVLKEALDNGKKVVDEKTKKDGEFKAKNDQVDAVVKELKAFGGLRQEEWITLNKVIDDSLPQPIFVNKDGKPEVISVAPINPEAKKKYWDKVALAAKAQNEYLKAELEGKTLKEASLKFKQQRLQNLLNQEPDVAKAMKAMWPRDYLEGNLFLFSIESVDARYVKDLKHAWTFAKKVQEKVAPPEVKGAVWANSADPEGAGWVVVVRGYTYHYDQSHFVTAVLGNNLASNLGIHQQFLTAEDLPRPGAAGSGAKPAAASAKSSSPAASTSNGEAKPDPTEPIVGKANHLILLATNQKGTKMPDVARVLEHMTVVKTLTAAQKKGSEKIEDGTEDLFGSGSDGSAKQGPAMRDKSGGPAGGGNAGIFSADGSVKQELFVRASPDGVEQTDFVFLIFWKGPSAADYSLPEAAGGKTGVATRHK